MKLNRILPLFVATVLCIAQVTRAASVSGVYARDDSGLVESMDASCPKGLEITNSGKEITGADVKVDGTACTSGDASLEEAEDFFSEEDLEGFNNFFDKFIASRISSTFNCADFLIAESSSLLAVRFTKLGEDLVQLSQLIDVEGLDFSDINLGEIDDGVDYLIINREGADGVCVFTRTSDSTSTTPGSGSTGTGGTGTTSGSDTSSDNECFPASASVRLHNGDVKTMAQLRIGDNVQTGDNTFSPIFAWTHHSQQVVSTFVQVKHSDNDDVFKVTPNHFVYRYSGELVLAKDLVVGDILISGNGAPSTVESVDLVQQRGLYNPQTVHGDIVVDGVRASTYTLAVEPKAAHALLSPVRAVFKALSALQPWSSSCEV